MGQTQLETCFETIFNIFHQYSVRVGHADTLTKGELRQLIEKEVPTFLKEKDDPNAIDEIFADLDKNEDREISFQEFINLVSMFILPASINIPKE